MICFSVFLLYLPLSLSQPLTASRCGSWRWGWGSLSMLSLLHLILSPSFPFCFISSNLLPHSFPVGTLFGSVFFDLIHKKMIFCLSLVLVPFGFTKFLSLMMSIKFFPLDFLNANSLYHLFTGEDNKLVFCWIKVAMQSEWFIYLSWTHQKLSSKLINMIAYWL